MNPYYGQDHGKAGTMAAETVGIRIRHRPPRQYKKKGSWPLSCLKTRGENETPLEAEVPVLTASQAFVACALQTVATDFEFIEEPTAPLFPLLRKST